MLSLSLQAYQSISCQAILDMCHSLAADIQYTLHSDLWNVLHSISLLGTSWNTCTNGSHYSLDWTTGLDYWTGLLDSWWNQYCIPVDSVDHTLAVLYTVGFTWQKSMAKEQGVQWQP